MSEHQAENEGRKERYLEESKAFRKVLAEFEENYRVASNCLGSTDGPVIIDTAKILVAVGRIEDQTAKFVGNVVSNQEVPKTGDGAEIVRGMVVYTPFTPGGIKVYSIKNTKWIELDDGTIAESFYLFVSADVARLWRRLLEDSIKAVRDQIAGMSVEALHPGFNR